MSDNNFFGNDNLYMDDQPDDIDRALQGNGNNINGQDFSNEFPDDINEPPKNTKKIALIIAGVGLTGLFLTFLLAGAAGRVKDNKVSKNDTYSSDKVSYVQTVDPNQLMNTTGNTVSKPAVENNYSDWTELTDNKQIEFKGYVETNFTVTDIKHYVRNSSPDGTYIIKTTLTGMISGYSGTYTLDVPYDKGVILATESNLGVGTTFTVSVLIGEYNGKKFIGDITTNVSN